MNIAYTPSLLHALESIDQQLIALGDLLQLPDENDRQQWHRLIRRKLLPRLAPDFPLTVTICGGGSSGKSSLFNALIGEAISPVGGRAGLNRRVLAALNPQRAAKAGFDWSDARGVVAKVREEIDELDEAVESGAAEAVSEEIGDLLFSCCNLARHVEVDAESALRDANAKFERRFRRMERALADAGRGLEQATPEELDDHWEASKRAEGDGGA